MRQHEINKRKKLKQKRRESSKSQVEKKHKQKFKVREDRSLVTKLLIKLV